MENIKIQVINNFDDPLLDQPIWEQLIDHNDIKSVFLTKAWLSTWWDIFGRGRLLLIVAFIDETPVALAPLFADSGMIYFVGSGASDYLDLIGNPSNSHVLQAMLEAARNATADFVGFRFYHIPGRSSTRKRLKSVSSSINLNFFDEGGMVAPVLDLKQNYEQILSKKSLKRHHNYFTREGNIEVKHLTKTEDILPLLDVFFQQHISRWEITPYPSLFLDTSQCEFYKHLVRAGSKAGWLRFTSVYWNEQPIAFHFGFSYRGVYLWYKPSFEIKLAKRSPGEVLLKQLFIAANQENDDVFDFGLGDEAFKNRFANRIEKVVTVGMYLPELEKNKDLEGE